MLAQHGPARVHSVSGLLDAPLARSRPAPHQWQMKKDNMNKKEKKRQDVVYHPRFSFHLVKDLFLKIIIISHAHTTIPPFFLC